MSRTAADYMAEALAQAGVERIYGVSGTRSTASRMRSGVWSPSTGFTCAMKRGLPLPREQRRISPGTWRSAPAVAVPAIFI
jgi:hypothetical protein